MKHELWFYGFLALYGCLFAYGPLQVDTSTWNESSTFSGYSNFCFQALLAGVVIIYHVHRSLEERHIIKILINMTMAFRPSPFSSEKYFAARFLLKNLSS